MLETMRRHSRNVIIYVLFGILIAVFVISFGPQSGQQSGCMPSSSYAAKVGDREITEHSWRFAMNARGFASGAMSEKAQLMRARETVMDALIEREILAQAAEASGFRLSDSEVEARIAKGELYILGQPLRGETVYFVGGAFDYDALESFAHQLGLPGVSHFVEEQRREMLAARMRDLLVSSVRVSPEEVQERYRRQHDKVWLEYVKFEPRKLKRTLELTDADLDAYIAAHEEELKKEFELDKNLYTGRGKWVQARVIFVASARKRAAAEQVEEEAPATQPATQPTQPDATPDPDRAKAEATLARIKAGDDFAKLARERSDDPTSARRGGRLDWRPVTGLGLGPEVTAAIEPLTPGQTSGVIETSRGYYIVRVEQRSDGDLTFDHVKRDLAEDAARDERAKAMAKGEAEKALAAAQGGTPFEQLFDKPGAIDEEPEPIDEPEEPLDKPEPATQPAGPDKPDLMESGPVTRNGSIVAGESGDRYVGKSAELAKAVFGEIAVGSLGPKVYEVEDGFVIVKVVKREEASTEEFDKQKDELAEGFAFEKAIQLVDTWTSRRCRAVDSAGGITVNPAYIEYNDAQGRPQKSNYHACTSAGTPTMELPIGE